MDCHEVVPTSRNDDSPLTVFARKSVRIDEAIHRENPLIENMESQGDSAESLKDSSDSAESNFYGLPQHFFKMLRNDENGTILCNSAESRNDENIIWIATKSCRLLAMTNPPYRLCEGNARSNP